MKKFAKGCLISALSMLSIGFVIVVICIIIGGTSLIGYLKSNTLHQEHLANFFDDTVITFHNGGSSIDFTDEYPIHSGNHHNSQVALSSDIHNLNIELGGGKCIISDSADEYFHISTDNAQDFQYYIENQTLYIKGFDIVSLNIHDTEYNCIHLEIPKHFVFENMEIELGAGCIEADTLSANGTIHMEIGAGEFLADSLTTSNLITELGAGNIEIYNASIQDSHISVGLGNMSLHGIIAKDLTADCGMGNLEFILNDQLENHNYSINCSMGNIMIGSKSYSGLSHSSNIENGSDSDYTLECGMGNLSIEF